MRIACVFVDMWQTTVRRLYVDNYNHRIAFLPMLPLLTHANAPILNQNKKFELSLRRIFYSICYSNRLLSFHLGEIILFHMVWFVFHCTCVKYYVMVCQCWLPAKTGCVRCVFVQCYLKTDNWKPLTKRKIVELQCDEYDRNVLNFLILWSERNLKWKECRKVI